MLFLFLTRDEEGIQIIKAKLKVGKANVTQIR